MQDQDNTPSVSEVRKTFLDTYNYIQGPRARAKTFRTISQSATSNVEHLAPQEGWSEERKNKERLVARIADEQAFRERKKSVSRPKSGWLGSMMRGLPQLPDIERPTRDEFPDLKRYRALAVLLFAAMILFVGISFMLLPPLLASPAFVATDTVGGDGTGSSILGWIVRFIVIALFTAVILKGPKWLHTKMFEAALDEEIWFRLGAENFTWGQRVRSCVQFAAAHLINLLFFFATLGGFALAAGVIMWVYLREFKASGDQRRAVATAALFHADYNATVVYFLMGINALGMLSGMLA